MIDYTSVLNILRSKEFVDKTNCFIKLLGNKYTTLENCGRTGSSLFLKTFACFIDENIDSGTAFVGLNIGGSDCFESEINSYRTVYLDFSDFNSTNYEGAVRYLKDKMSAVYKQYFNFFDTNTTSYYEYSQLEYAVDVIEKTADLETLQSSLRKLLLQSGGYENHRKNKVAVLIDNLVLLETVSKANGYSDEMQGFLRQFVVEDIYKYCDLFLQIGDADETSDSCFFGNRYLTYRYFSVFANNMRKRLPEMVVPLDCQFEFDVRVTESNDDWEERIANAKKRIQFAKEEEEQRRLDRIRRERMRYAENIAPEIPRFSCNLGIREKRLNKLSPKYIEIEDWLKVIYRNSRPRFEADKVYRLVQRIKENDLIVADALKFGSVLEKLPQGNPRWKTNNAVSSWSSWVQATYERADERYDASPARAENIKAYVCFDNTAIGDIFVESLDYLLLKANETFAAKIAVCNRADQMCYWISQNDFKHLEDFYKTYSGAMVKSLPFVAYKGKLGISKDFPGVDDSHNLTMAHVVSDYFKTITDEEEVDLEGMYNRYIAKWNADLSDDDAYLGFKSNSALSLIVILDTLDYILSESEVDESSFLLSGEKEIWRVLASSRCWADVNEKWVKVNVPNLI